MRSKILAILLAIILTMTFFNVNASADEEHRIIIDSMTTSETGYIEIIGHLTNAPEGSQIACLIGREGALNESGVSKTLEPDDIAWIDQVETGNNGTFLIQFSVNAEKFSDERLYVGLGSQYLQQPFIANITVPELPIGLSAVVDNSVLYGRDIYYISGALYDADSIAESIAFGGSNIYFKIGGLWYNLMDEEAVDNSFLTEENAVDEEEIEALNPRYYYGFADRFEFE